MFSTQYVTYIKEDGYATFAHVQDSLSLTDRDQFGNIEFSTRRAAQSVGLGDQIGVLEPGYSADLLVVSDNPADDISVIQYPEAVFCSGKLRVRDGSIYMSGNLEQ